MADTLRLLRSAGLLGALLLDAVVELMAEVSAA